MALDLFGFSIGRAAKGQSVDPTPDGMKSVVTPNDRDWETP